MLSKDVLDYYGVEKAYDNEISKSVLYSKRDHDTITLREILATALEGAAHDSTEWMALQKYKNEIGEINEMEHRLTEIRRDIWERQFSAGGDRDALIRQRNRANILAIRLTGR